MKSFNSIFWLNDPFILFKNDSIIPNTNICYEEKLNSITRLVIILFLILYLFGYKQSFLFLLLSLFFIIILYYLKKNKMTTHEYYTDFINNSENLYKEGINNYKKNRYSVTKFPSYYTNERIETKDLIPDNSFVSKNQNLCGPANPKTLVNPVVVPPSYDFTYWKKNDFVFHSMVNEKRIQDYYGSGYITNDDSIIENYTENYPNVKSNYNNNQNLKQSPIDVLGDYSGKYSYEINNGSNIGSSNFVSKDFLLNNDNNDNNDDYLNFKKNDKVLNYPGNVNKSCTYDSTNIDFNLPTNFMAGNCERNENMKDMNNEIFTSTITPGVYYKNQIIEPLNNNIGISFDQQIPPRQVSFDKNGNKLYTALDPNLYQPLKDIDKNDYGTSPYEVYDPRSNGYGTSYRQYEHELTGQPRFFYDDINAVRRPNYITRTNIDHLLNSDSYGIMDSNENIMSKNCNSRKIAEEGILNNIIDHRTDLMTRLMRKRNAELWQKRIAPLRKG